LGGLNASKKTGTDQTTHTEEKCSQTEGAEKQKMACPPKGGLGHFFQERISLEPQFRLKEILRIECVAV
jgi:hypothetical protein